MLKIIKILKKLVILIEITILAIIALPPFFLFAIIVFLLKIIIKNICEIEELTEEEITEEEITEEKK